MLNLSLLCKPQRELFLWPLRFPLGSDLFTSSCFFPPRSRRLSAECCYLRCVLLNKRKQMSAAGLISGERCQRSHVSCQSSAARTNNLLFNAEPLQTRVYSRAVSLTMYLLILWDSNQTNTNKSVQSSHRERLEKCCGVLSLGLFSFKGLSSVQFGWVCPEEAFSFSSELCPERDDTRDY